MSRWTTYGFSAGAAVVLVGRRVNTLAVAELLLRRRAFGTALITRALSKCSLRYAGQSEVGEVVGAPLEAGEGTRFIARLRQGPGRGGCFHRLAASSAGASMLLRLLILTESKRDEGSKGCHLGLRL